MKGSYLIILFPVFLLTACHNQRQEGKNPALARVFNKYLYQKDLEGLVPAGTTKKDSTLMADQYVQDWIKRQLVVKQAENNLNRNQKDFTRELEEYRNSLIVYAYESKLIGQKLDTVITEKQLDDYYKENPGDFELKENILKVLYVKLNLKEKNIYTIRHLIQSTAPDDRIKLSRLCASVAVNSYLDDSSWLYFNDLLKEIPITTYNQEEYLRNHRYVEFSDQEYTYLVNILDFKIKEGNSPFNLEKGNIRNIMLNKRKVKLINDMEQEIYNNALKDKDFEVFQP